MSKPNIITSYSLFVINVSLYCSYSIAQIPLQVKGLSDSLSTVGAATPLPVISGSVVTCPAVEAMEMMGRLCCNEYLIKATF